MSATPPPANGRWSRWLRRIVLIVLWGALALATLWASGALLFDFAIAQMRWPFALLYGLAALIAAIVCKGRVALAILASGFVLVLAWWLTLQPSNNRPWQPDVAQTAWAENAGDQVTLHNVRNCDYRTELDYTPRWETRTIDLTKLRGVDLAINYWGSAWMAHPIVSFQFEDAAPVCFSIETRKEVGESYSAIGGLYRQFELICVCADERDVVRVRTNYRHGEDVYLYHTKMTAEQARGRFRDYLATMNALQARPRWYNAVTTNCTTVIRTQHASANRVPWDWRILLNGYMDEMLYDHGALLRSLPFAELKSRSLINAQAREADGASDFSQRIRAHLPTP